MFKRHTTRVRHDKNSRVLNVHVMSARIAWHGMLKTLRGFAKLLCVLAVLGLVGVGGWFLLRRGFLENDEFRLQLIELNPNTALDEQRLVEVTGLDCNSSLFTIPVRDIQKKLAALPEVASVDVERHLPGTLKISVTARTPVAWISQTRAGDATPERMLADRAGTAYPCPALQRGIAEHLPVILLNPSSPWPLSGKPIAAPEFRRAIRLIHASEEVDANACQWITSIEQINIWSMRLITRDGVQATFGTGDHARQVADFLAACEHARREGYHIQTINLIPEHNIPVTVSGAVVPKAIPVSEPKPAVRPATRRDADMRSLLDRG